MLDGANTMPQRTPFLLYHIYIWIYTNICIFTRITSKNHIHHNREFNPFIFKVIIDREEVTIAILLIVFCLSCCFFSSLFLSCCLPLCFVDFFVVTCFDFFLTFFVYLLYFLYGYHQTYIKHLIVIIISLELTTT